MKKKLVNLTTLAVVVMLLLSACAPAASLSSQANNLLQLPAGALEKVSAVIPQVKGEKAAPSTTPNQPHAGAVNPEVRAALDGTLEEIYSRVNPQVVNIRVVIQRSATTLDQSFQIPGLPFNLPGLPFGNPEGQTPDQSTPEQPQDPGSDGQSMPYAQGAGSGFVWDKEGYIVTNNHVVAGADKIEVTFYDGTVASAKLVGTDPYSDLAVIQVDVPADRLSPVEVADSRAVKVGQLAIAIGNPFALEGTMTVGIVSALGRTLPATEGTTNGPTYSIPDIIQTDAPINPGNSGGVLVDENGQLIGVTAAIESPVSANAGIGFAIPSAIVQRVVPVLIKEGGYQHPYLGISGMDLSPDLAKAMNLDENQRGVLVEEVTSGAPAGKAGLRGSDHQVTLDGQKIQVGGDVITAIEGQPVKKMADLIAYLASNTEVGQQVTLTVRRGGNETDIQVTLEARPGSGTKRQNTQTQSQPKPNAGSAWLGIKGQDLNTDLAEAMKLDSSQQGVLVQEVEANSPADQAGLQGSFKPLTLNGEQVMVGGDVIVALDGNKIDGMDALRQALAGHQAGDEVTLTVLRRGEQVKLQVTLGERPSQ